MSIELVFIALLLIWGSMMAYLVYLHVLQKKLMEEMSKLARLKGFKENKS